MADVIAKYDIFWPNLWSGKYLWETEVWRVAFLADTYPPDLAGDTTFADVAAHQITGAINYPVGGPAIQNKTVDKAKADGDNITLAQLTATFRYIVLYQDGTVGGVVQPLGGYYEPVAGSNVVIQSSDYLIEWPTAGIFVLT